MNARALQASSTAPEFLEPGARIDGRYAVDKALGRGGAAVIYRVHDLVEGRDKALKLMLTSSDPQNHLRHVELFQREFHTLSQLRHPRIVEVHEYGVAGPAPYYTMELLDGGDLLELTPLDWRRACTLARDACSALSLLHSRRLVYRDMSPRNVRCTMDGRAKLIDFGALVPMGPCKQVVGTASFCAPELLDLQPLDGRTDLYSLGATLYFTLTGQRAYSARDFRDLRDAWTRLPPRPSRIVPEIPAALDDLVMDLLQLDPLLRPASAAEVMERLAGIAELPIGEQLLVSQAYLSTPMLVGQATRLSRVRETVTDAMGGRGAALLIRGLAGLGRSRFLAALALDAQVLGVTVLRADAEDAQSGDYGVVQALALQLTQKLPDLAPALLTPLLPVLGHVLPKLLEQAPELPLATFADPAELRPRVQTDMRAWFEQVAQHRPLLLAIDDVQRADGPSAAFLALLATNAAQHRIFVAVTSDLALSAGSAALRMLEQQASTLDLAPLSAAETRELLASVFGEVSHLSPLATRIHDVSGGNPRDVMRLAQHLLDNRVVQYQSGAWALPSRIDATSLPSSIAEALQQTVDALSPAARDLACTMALADEQRFSFHECGILSELSPAHVLPVLDELVAAGVLKQFQSGHGLSQQAWRGALRSDEQNAPRHARLARLFAERPGDDIRTTEHLLRCGEQARAADVLVRHAELSQSVTDPSSDAFIKLLDSLPEHWAQTYKEVLHFCKQAKRPRLQLFCLRARLAGVMSAASSDDLTPVSELVEQLRVDTGLDIYAALDATLDPLPRLQRSFELAQARHKEFSEADRSLDPLSALRPLARALIQFSALIVTTRRLELLASFPNLMPLAPLSPAFGVVQQLVDGVAHRYLGRCEKARAVYVGVIERMSQPDRAGLDDSHYGNASLGIRLGLGFLDASWGLASAMQWADDLEKSPLYQVNAWLVRMLYHLWQGETQEAASCKRRADFLRVQNNPHQYMDGSYLPIELGAHVAAGNLMQVKRMVHELEPQANRYPGWLPMLRYARGEYHRLRGDYANAVVELEATISAGHHQAWADAAGAHLTTLSELGEHRRALSLAHTYLQAAKDAAIEGSFHLILVPLALASAALGDAGAAAAHADAALQELERLGATGLSMHNARAARARVARAAANRADFERYAELCVRQLAPSLDRRIVARYSDLLEPNSASGTLFSSNARQANGELTQQTVTAAITSIETVTDFHGRTELRLQKLVANSGSQAGVLYSLVSSEPQLVAQVGEHTLPLDIDEQARAHLTHALNEEEWATRTGDASDAPESWKDHHGTLYRPVLLQYATDTGLTVTGLAVLVEPRVESFEYPALLAFELRADQLESSSSP